MRISGSEFPSQQHPWYKLRHQVYTRCGSFDMPCGGIICPNHPRPPDPHTGLGTRQNTCTNFSSPTLLFSPPYNPAKRSFLWRGRRVLCKAHSPRGTFGFPISSQVLRTSFSARKAAGTVEGVCQQDFPPHNLRQAGAEGGYSLPSYNKNPIITLQPLANL